MNLNRIFIIFCLIFTTIYFLSYLKYYHEKDGNYSTVKLKSFSFDSYKIQYKIRNTVGFVFYGRKRSASILIRYLDRNLKKNGGILDKIIFAVKTNNQEDLEYLKRFLEQNGEYYSRVDFSSDSNYKVLYTVLHDDDLVFKIDDDIVFISNGTFENMIEEYLTGTHFILSANVVNHPILSDVHVKFRAILPFYETKNGVWEKAKNITEIDDTEAMRFNYGSDSKWWANPKCAAIAHESFLYHAKNNNLDVYKFKLWDFNAVDYSRWSINFILIWGKHVNKLNSTHNNIASD